VTVVYEGVPWIMLSDECVYRITLKMGCFLFGNISFIIVSVYQICVCEAVLVLLISDLPSLYEIILNSPLFY
jgi:hypothetical protein